MATDPKAPAKAETKKVDVEPVSGEADYDPTTRPGYQEYPKVIHLPDGQVVTATSAEDEAEKMKGPKPEKK